jgi:hypothetical protein
MSFFSRLFGHHSTPATPPPPKPASAPAPSPAPAPAADAAIPGTIVVDRLSYCPFEAMVAPAGAGGPGQPAWSFAGPVEDRGRFRPPEAQLDLKATYGAYMVLGGRNVLIVVDRAATLPGSGEWGLIHAAAKTLTDGYDALSAQAKDALGNLNAVIFAKSPKRSFASVAGGWFFYDTDEFLNSAGGLISPAYVASNMVHDANHVRQFHARIPHTGDAAEIDGWQLQVDNKDALGLQKFEVDFIKTFIADPSKARQRMEEDV